MIIQRWKHDDIVHELFYETPHLTVDVYREKADGNEALALLVFELSPEARDKLLHALQLPEDADAITQHSDSSEEERIYTVSGGEPWT